MQLRICIMLARSVPQTQLDIQFGMLELYVLVQRPLRPIALLAGLNRTAVVPLDFPSSPSEPLLAVVLAFLSPLDVVAFLLQFGESGGELVTFVEELTHLGEKDGVGEEEAGVFVVVGEVVIFLGVCLHYIRQIINKISVQYSQFGLSKMKQ